MSLEIGETDSSPLRCSRIDRDASALLDALDGRSKGRRPPHLRHCCIPGSWAVRRRFARAAVERGV